MAFQAAIAITIAELLGWYFNLEHGYWATLTAMALTAQTWGESVKRSFERVTMTVLGGICGTVLYFILSPDETLSLVILLGFVFITVYMLSINNLIAVFTLTGFVVFLFALLGDWSLLLLKERIDETVLGALIAIAVGFFFLPVRTNINTLWVGQLEKTRACLSLAFVKSGNTRIISSQNLYADFQEIRKKSLSIRYEVLFHRMSLHEFNLLLTHMSFCTQYVVNLVESYQWLVAYLTKKDRERIHLAVETTLRNLEIMIDYLKSGRQQAMLPAQDLHQMLSNCIHEDPQRFTTFESEALGFFNLMYFFTHLNTRLNEVYLLLYKVMK
ncbi:MULTISPECIES: FUSC family protein [unclassified Legionella]|uniref:FUSC family protein n=1 Tax=unclassified Legionella TaxID=2622702 RepID=UPI0013EF92F4|nr:MULTISPECIES: FUSC family protein [unclassified Legionella]MDI9819877.1 FUSC family protein [Legionella sp. PL877]